MVDFADGLDYDGVGGVFAEAEIVDVELDYGVEAVFVDDADGVFAFEDHPGG